jgi:hypothetical protein
MKKLLAFKTVAVDTLAIPAGTTNHAGESFSLFGDYCDLNDDDVTKEGEEDTIQWILSSSGRGLLLEELGVGPGAFLALSVKRPVIPREGSKPGDIDLLICADRRADQAIGIQCKRVKVKAFNQEEDDFNKLSDV